MVIVRRGINMKDISGYHIIGIITEVLTKDTMFDNSGILYASPGIMKHIKKHMSDFSDNEKDDIIKTMKDICANPDYVGEHPSKKGKSLELVKRFDNSLLLAIEIDSDNEYNYVSSLYKITDGKINNRVNSGRFINYEEPIEFVEETLEQVASTVVEVENTEDEVNAEENTIDNDGDSDKDLD